jgi:hypothetical protein
MIAVTGLFWAYTDAFARHFAPVSSLLFIIPALGFPPRAFISLIATQLSFSCHFLRLIAVSFDDFLKVWKNTLGQFAEIDGLSRKGFGRASHSGSRCSFH